MDVFDSHRMAAFEAALIASEQSSGRAPSGMPGDVLSANERDWLAVGHFFGFSSSAWKHPDPIVSGLARLQQAQRDRQLTIWPSIIGDLLHNIGESDAERRETIGAAALLSLARVSLRAGAWDLLSKCLPAGLALARVRPQKRRLSVATGLVAEWALASGNARIACIYATESLRHGAENQRIQGYLGFAHALAGKWDYAFLLFGNALAIQTAQLATANRRAFGVSNLIRACAIRSIVDGDTRPLKEAEHRFREHRKLLESNRSTMPMALARLGIFIARQNLNYGVEDDLMEIIREIRNQGRWRDLILLERHSRDKSFLKHDHLSVINDINHLPAPKLTDSMLVDQVLNELPTDLQKIAIYQPENQPLPLFCI